MNNQVAIIGGKNDPVSPEKLKDALQSKGVSASVCPAGEPREMLRWAMDISPDHTPICIFADSDGRLTASIYTALDPAITPVIWCPVPENPDMLATILADTPALLCLASDPAIPAQLVRNLIVSASRAQLATDSPKSTARIETLTPTPNNPVSIVSQKADHDAGDLVAYQQLEQMMAAPIKKVVKKEPIQIQPAALDFSVPLRELMTQGKKIAQKGSHTEVLGAHYLAALDEPYITLFTRAGIDKELVKGYLSGFDSGEEISGEPVISDEVFKSVSFAKQKARADDAPCVRVIDFLRGLLQLPDGSVADILDDADASPEQLLKNIDDTDTPEEACGAPFFQPSSLDQDSFYQFDASQVKNVEERLRDLPGFQKAAARVAEARGKAAGSHAATTAPIAENRAPAVPPEKPEILKITGDFPPVDLIEHIADRLLEGQLIAFRSDIMFALVADATNSEAVERLRQAADVPDDKPLSILIHSTSRLKHIVKADLDALEPLFDELWPGPLTLIFQSFGSVARSVTTSKAASKIAVRLPADNSSLAILSMLGRPLAVTSWEKPKADLTGHAAIIVDSDEPVNAARTTIVDLTSKPWQILREGAVPGQSVLRFYGGQ